MHIEKLRRFEARPELGRGRGQGRNGGQEHSWEAIREIADDYGCLVKLGGRWTTKRCRRPAARLVVKGFNVEECFYAVLQESREAFKKRSDIKFNSRTVPLHQQPAANSQDSQRAQRRQQWRWLV